MNERMSDSKATMTFYNEPMTAPQPLQRQLRAIPGTHARTDTNEEWPYPRLLVVPGRALCPGARLEALLGTLLVGGRVAAKEPHCGTNKSGARMCEWHVCI